MVSVSFTRNSGRLREFSFRAAGKLFQVQYHCMDHVSVLRCHCAMVHYKRQKASRIHRLGSVRADNGNFLVVGFFTLFSGQWRAQVKCLWYGSPPNGIPSRKLRHWKGNSLEAEWDPGPPELSNWVQSDSWVLLF